MHSDMESQTSSLVSHERQLVVYLQLTSLSGEDYQITVDLQEFDRFNEFETAVLEQLPTIGNSPLLDKTPGSSCAVRCGTPSEIATSFR